MASLSDLIIAGSAKQAGSAALTGSQQALNQGIQLAQVAQDLDSQKANLQQQKEKSEQAKFNRMMKITDSITRQDSPRARKNLAKALTSNMQKMGLQVPSEMSLDQLVNDEGMLDNLRAMMPELRKLSGNPQLRQEVVEALADELGVAGTVGQLASQGKQARADQRAAGKEGRAEEREDLKLGQQEFKNVQSLRKEFSADPVTKNTKEARQAFAKIATSAASKDAAGDLALLFNFMKVLDPGSVVRESEFRAAAKAGSLPEQVQAFAETVISGNKLADSQRDRFLKQAEGLMNAQLGRQQQVNERFRTLANESGFEGASDSQLGLIGLAPVGKQEAPQEQVAQAPAPDREAVVASIRAKLEAAGQPADEAKVNALADRFLNTQVAQQPQAPAPQGSSQVPQGLDSL